MGGERCRSTLAAACGLFRSGWSSSCPSLVLLRPRCHRRAGSTWIPPRLPEVMHGWRGMLRGAKWYFLEERRAQVRPTKPGYGRDALGNAGRHWGHRPPETAMLWRTTPSGGRWCCLAGGIRACRRSTATPGFGTAPIGFSAFRLARPIPGLVTALPMTLVAEKSHSLAAGATAASSMTPGCGTA